MRKFNSYNFLLLVLTIICELQNQIKAQNPAPLNSYPNQITLQEPDLAYLYWSPNNTDITFEIHYKNTSRWVLFGLSTATFFGNLSDVVVAWVNDDGTGYFADSNINTQTVLRTDLIQNWYVTNAYTQNDYRVLTFTRKIQLCNSNNVNKWNLDIQPGNNNTIVFELGQMADDLTGKLGDFQPSLLNYQSSVNLLNQTSGPFSCYVPSSPVMFSSTPTAFYSNKIDLIDGVYRLYWNYTATDLIGEVHVNTS